MTRIIGTLALLLLGSLCAFAQEKTKPGPTFPPYSLPENANFSIRDVSIRRVVSTEAEKPLSFQIAGSLRVPKSDRTGTRWPAVLWVSGSGSQTRHGYAPQARGRMLDVGSYEIHDAVASAGFVVLSTDDRGIGKTPPGEAGVKPLEIGYDELVGDAQAALAWLRRRDEVDPEQVFIMGHSEGGLTAPILAARNPWVAGIVCMGSLGRNLWEVTLDQVTASMAKLPAAAREANLKVQKEFMQACKEGREPNFDILGPLAAAQIKAAWKTSVLPIRAWWGDHFKLDVPKIHKSVACPVFIAQGEKDFQTSAERDARQFLRDLLAGKSADLCLKVYPDLDHLFKPCGGKPSTAKMYFTDRRVDESFIRDVVQWLGRRSGK